MPQNDGCELTIDLGVLSAEPAEEYHAKAGEYLSSHQLLDFMACPWLYRKKQLGLIKDEDTPALLIGRATHCRILEGRDAYEAQFAIGGPVNPRTDKPFGKDTSGSARRHRTMCFDAVAQTPGLAAREIENRLGIKAHKRLPELRRAGMVRSGRSRTCTVSGRLAMTWQPNIHDTTNTGDHA